MNAMSRSRPSGTLTGGLNGVRLQGGGERECNQRQCERPLDLPHDRAQDGMAVAEGATENHEDDAMREEGGGHCDQQHYDAGEPIRRPEQRVADGR